jgi:putative ABC transport system ATP-binding protein
MTPPPAPTTAKAAPAASPAEGLTLAGVSHVVAGERVLHDVSLAASPGEVVAVVGPSGSGKTTLLAIAGGLLRPTAGSVLVGGRDLAAAPERERARMRARDVAFVFQGANLAPFLTSKRLVALNARLAGRPAAEAAAETGALLAAVGLERRAGARPGTLSGGERQRLAVAAALAKRPRVLLADEPTAALDSERGREVMELLGGLARERGATVLLSTHDERLLDLADRVLRLRDGRLAETAVAPPRPVGDG